LLSISWEWKFEAQLSSRKVTWLDWGNKRRCPTRTSKLEFYETKTRAKRRANEDVISIEKPASNERIVMAATFPGRAPDLGPVGRVCLLSLSLSVLQFRASSRLLRAAVYEFVAVKSSKNHSFQPRANFRVAVISVGILTRLRDLKTLSLISLSPQALRYEYLWLPLGLTRKLPDRNRYKLHGPFLLQRRTGALFPSRPALG
jgi:hypothetical protein